MSEFGEMLKEALVGEEPYVPDPGREALEKSVRKFEARLRAARFMTGVMVGFPTILLVVVITIWARSDAAAIARYETIYALLVFFALFAVGTGKMWFSSMMNHTALMKEVKVTQIRIVELQEKMRA